MIFIILFFSVLSSITIKSEDIPELNSQIYENVKVTKFKDNYYKFKVTIANSEKIQIFVNHSNSKNISIDKLYAFYIALNCRFADWAINKINAFVWQSPLFREYRDSDNEDVEFDRLSEINFENILPTFANSVKEDVEHMVRILINFIDTNSNISYYNDTSILEALELFRIKLNYLSLYTEIPEVMGTPISNILRLFIKDMNAFQRVLLRNCPGLLSSGQPSDFQMYWVTEIGNVQNSNEIEKFFFNINNIQLLSNEHTNCSCQEVFLEIFVKPPTDDDISRDIKSGIVFFDSKYEYKLNDIFDEINVSYDAELILRYQEAISARIMYIIFSNIITNPSNEVFTIDTTNKIMDINAIFSKDQNSFPTYLVDGFNILYKYFILNHPIKKDFTKFYNSVSIFKIDSELRIGREWSDSEYLNQLFNRILENIDDLKCFQETYKRLHIQYNKTYEVPFTQRKLFYIPGVIPKSKTKINIYQESCSFAKKLYLACYQALMFVHQSFNILQGEDNSLLKYQSLEILFTIRKYFNVIVNGHLRNGDFLKVGHWITPILVNLLRTFDDVVDTFEIQRILNLILVDINVAGLNVCIFPNTNYLSFNNVGMQDFVNLEDLDESFVTYVQLMRNDFDLDRLNNPSYSISKNILYFDLDDIYNKFFNTSQVFKKYRQIVHFNWKGQVKSVLDIYSDVATLLLNSQDVYAFYDIINKFYIAVIYYEIRKVLKKTFDLNIVLEYFNQLSNILKGIECINFPDALNPLFLKIKLLLNRVGQLEEAEDMIKRTKQEVEEELQKYIIFPEDSSSLQGLGKLKRVMHGSSYKNLSNVVKELLDIVVYYEGLRCSLIQGNFST